MHPSIATLVARVRLLRFYVPHLTTLGVALLGGLGMAIAHLSPRIPANDAADRWPLPRWSAYKAGPQRDDIARLNLWAEDPGRRKVEVVAKAPEPPWRFIGTVQEGKRRLAVIELDQGRKVQRVDAGEVLPNGAKVTAVGVGELTYNEDDTEKTLKLFALQKDKNFPGTPNKK
jgi:hypothetical protein